MQRILNAHPTPPDEIKVEERVTLDRTIVVPSRLILPNIPPLMDQGETGTCVAHAAYVLYGHHFKQRYGHFPAIGEPEILRFYDLCKKVDGQPDPARIYGTTLLTALRTMAGSGFPLADGSRGPHIAGYQYVGDDYAETRLAMAQYGDPILFRVNWDANWFYLPVSRILKAPVGQWVGGHAMADFGYDDDLAATSADADADRNSWGTWSVKGNGSCYFKAEYKAHAYLEAWRVTGML